MMLRRLSGSSSHHHTSVWKRGPLCSPFYRSLASLVANTRRLDLQSAATRKMTVPACTTVPTAPTDDEIGAVSVLTRVELIGPEGDTASTTSMGLESATQACIRLDSQEERLFQVVVETAEAFARGQISLPPTAEGEEEQEQQEDGGAENTTKAATITTTTTRTNSEDQGEETSESPRQRQRRKRPTLRVAGGWVRDKLLGLTTHDVDLAVDCLTGVEFAQLIHEYAAITNQPSITDGHRIGVVPCNPEQSKHLETAALKVCGLDVDLANLRSQETYDHHSRIPTVRLGTPLDDAERRDFTINALFFNLHTKSVEDWTRRGMSDLYQGLMETPLDPIQTFFDDPLRMLRAIRFSVRFQFVLDPQVVAACRRDDIHQALRRKVSRERVGKELEGMLSGTRARPVDALHAITNLQLTSSTFTLPVLGTDQVTAIEGQVLGEPYRDDVDNDNAGQLSTDIEEKGWKESDRLLGLLPAVLESHEKAVSTQAGQTGSVSSVDKRLLPVAVFLLPFRSLRYQEKNKTERSFPVAQYVFLHGLKFKQTDVRAMTLLQEQVDIMATLLRNAASIAKTDGVISSIVDISRLEAGLLLRTCKELWPTCLLLATVVLMGEETETSSSSSSDERGDGDEWIQVGNAVWAKIVALGLDECWKRKPLLDGKAVIRALNIPKGPQVGQLLEEQVRWMLQNPSGTTADCEAHLKVFKSRLEKVP